MLQKVIGMILLIMIIVIGRVGSKKIKQRRIETNHVSDSRDKELSGANRRLQGSPPVLPPAQSDEDNRHHRNYQSPPAFLPAPQDDPPPVF